MNLYDLRKFLGQFDFGSAKVRFISPEGDEFALDTVEYVLMDDVLYIKFT